MNCPMISVVMPVFNCRLYVDEAIRSIRAQTVTDFEFIIINDGSTDGSADILRRHAAEDRRIVLIDQLNSGIVAALNAGLRAARGKFIARMDGDDVAHPERLERQVCELDAHPDIVLLGTAADLTCPSGLTMKVGMWQRFGCSTDHFAIENELLGGFGAAVVHPTVMMRADALRAVGGYRERFKLVEDLDLFLRLARVGRVANLLEVLLAYRQHLGSTNHTKRAEQLALCKACISEAYADRGRKLPPDFKMEWAPVDRVGTLHTWVQNALLHRRPDIALGYLREALRLKPASRQGWRLAAKVLSGGIRSKTVRLPCQPSA
jgi:GT2 family glycosyltransferase